MASNLSKDHPWFQICHPRPNAKYQVFIFPAAGNAGSYYLEWDRLFPDCEFSLIIYPGRGSRFGDKLITSLQEYIDQLDKELIPYITKPCIFIGHSLGSLISFALAKHMVDKRKRASLIRFMVQMGRGPPHLNESDKSLADMTDAEIVEDLKRMADPSTKFIYDNLSYVELITPMLRADGQVGKAVLGETPLDIPIIAYGGTKEENLSESHLKRWEEATNAKDLFRVRMFDGHHNFPAECATEVLKCLKEDFDNLLNRSRN